MLRTALLFFLLLGFASAEIHAATATAATFHPIHRRKPTAGNYVPVYRYYRGQGRHKNSFGGLFKRRPTARHRSSHKGRAHRTM
ncbi:hypothetical protein [Hymenobacter terricola]|uniref:hypothetical protein n=1 Tax=Hymenobacter terricola TaxID=2819236 RepID=UPI001B317533|nr:hypothetical protein [Hymenobacter terricola]